MHVMLPFKLSYYRQATQALKKPRCYVPEHQGLEPSREGSHGAATKTAGVLCTVPVEVHYPGLPHSQQPRSQPDGQAAQPRAAGPRKALGPLLPATFAWGTRPQGLYQTISKPPLPPHCTCFPCSFPFAANSSNHSNLFTK